MQSPHLSERNRLVIPDAAVVEGARSRAGDNCPRPLQVGVTGQEAPRMSSFQIWLCVFFQKKSRPCSPKAL